MITNKQVINATVDDKKGISGDIRYTVLKGEKGDPGYTPVKGVDYFDGEKGDPGYTPIKGVDYFDGEKGDKGDTGETGATGPKGDKGETGAKGAPGVSPTVATSAISGGHRVTVTDADGSRSFDVMDGATGAKGDKGDKGDPGEVSVAQLDAALATKADIIINSATGSIASFSDGADDLPVNDLVVQIEPVQDLHGYDSPWVAGGGKNKLLFKTEDLTASKYGMELSYNATTEVITVTGTETHGSAFSIATSYQYRLPKFVAGETYTISRTQVTGNLYEKIYFQITYRKLDGTSSALVLNRTASTTFTVPNDFDIVADIFVGISTGVSDVNNAFKLQLESGSTATDWTPYSENICPITGWTGAKVTRTGKNLLCKPFEHYRNVSTDLSNYFWIKAGIYTLSIDSSTSTVWQYIARLKDRNGNVLSDNAHNPSPNFTYRSTLNGYTNGTNVSAKYIILNIVEDCYACFLFWNTDNGASDSFSGVQLELGSSVTEYTPYTGQTYSVTFPSEAGTVYGGTLDVTSGVLTVTKGLIASYAGETLPGEWISDRDVYAEGVTPTTGAQVVYQLTTPITYQLTPTEVRTLLGVNNIWADTGAVEVTYRADTKLYIDNKITQAIANALNA